jgi:hypothetical protein
LNLEGFLFLAAILQLVLGAIIFNMFKAHIGSISFTFASTLSSSLLAFSHFSREPWVPGFNCFFVNFERFKFFFDRAFGPVGDPILHISRPS